MQLPPHFLYSQVKVGRFCSYDRPSWRSLNEEGGSLNRFVGDGSKG